MREGLEINMVCRKTFLLTSEMASLVLLCKVVEQPSGHEFRTFRFHFDVVLVHGDPGVELHPVEVSKEVDVPSFVPISRSCDRFRILRSLERCCHS